MSNGNRTFYTERDIVDMAARGVRTLDVGDGVVLTDLAREKALSLGIRLVRGASSADASARPPAAMSRDEIVAKVKSAVIARLGRDVDAALLDAVITRVVAQIQ